MKRIASHFAVGPTKLPFLLLLLATAAWVSGVHGNDKRGHDNHVHDGNCDHGHDNRGHENRGHDNGIDKHGNDTTTRNYDEDTKSSVEVNKEKILKTEKKKEKIDPNATQKTPPLVDFSQLDLRVGHIVNVTKHPNVDTLYVETVDVGEDEPRTIVSGLANHIPLEKIVGRTVIVLCNLKPSKLGGVLSEGMVMCASSHDGKTVEILQPPPSILPGDIVVLEDRHERNPDKVLDPVVLEDIAKNLRTDADLQATYKGIPWLVLDGRYPQYTIGKVTAQTLRHCFIY